MCDNDVNKWDELGHVIGHGTWWERYPDQNDATR